MSAFKNTYDLKQSISIMDYALYLGYKIEKKKSSAKWIKMINEGTGDKIIIGLNNGRDNEDLYNSVIDPKKDAGDILRFCQYRLNGSVQYDLTKESFYNSMVTLNKFIGVYLSPTYKKQRENSKNFIEKKKTLAKIQNTDYNTLPLHDYSYFTNERKIDIKTLTDPLFKDQLFNTFFVNENQHIITNYAFGKYKAIENAKLNLVGLEVKGIRGYQSIVNDHDGVFISNIDFKRPIDYFYYCESGVDVLSYWELLQKSNKFNPDYNYCFMSTGGEIYSSKLKVIFDIIDTIPITEKTTFVSITDNDHKGNYYDLRFTAALLDKFTTPVAFDTIANNFYEYTFLDKDFILTQKNQMFDIVNSFNKEVDKAFSKEERYGQYIVFKTENNQPKLLFPKSFNPSNKHFKQLLNSLNSNRLFIPRKSKYKDWNDALKAYKNRKREISVIQIDSKKKSKLKL